MADHRDDPSPPRDPQPQPEIETYRGPSGGWGSVSSVTDILLREQVTVEGGRVLLHQNKPDGFACVSCAWAKPAHPKPFEFCENGAKATAWELTRKRVDPGFFSRHSLAELETWPDHELEAAGRLTHPMRWDATTDRYVEVTWQSAFEEIGRELRKLAPESVVFYTSGRASLEASYMWQLFARLYGSNHLPDSSNMCHESSSVALPKSIGSSVGTIFLDDFEHTDCIFYLGQNVGTSSPRMLHQLQSVAERGVPIAVFNPLKERGLERFTNPQSPTEMLSGSETRIASHYYQLKNGGDIAALFGVAKALIEADDAAQAQGSARVLDAEFIDQHTQGFEVFAEAARGHDWAALERHSGLSRTEMEEAARLYAKAERVMAVYGMGLTQHRGGVDNVAMVCNLMLLRGNIGKPGAGICPVRGHSNVQGQRTVGITEKPELVPLDKLAEQYGFQPPRWKGHGTTEACEGVLSGNVKGFLGLGGNFIRAVPETAAMEAAWQRLPLTVQVATKLNRNHVIHGEVAYLLPCLGRIEIDEQPGGPQAVSVEDSLAHIHGSRGQAAPASPHLRSEPRIVAEMAKATLEPNARVDWNGWAGDYAKVRLAIGETYPKIFRDGMPEPYERAMWRPGGFARPIPARLREWETESGKAQFIVPSGLFAGIEPSEADRAEVLQLMTLRSNDQFNTSIYGLHDRFRGVKGTRRVVFMNRGDIARLGLVDGETVSLATAVDDGVEREVHGMRVTAYDIPPGCCGAYYPECNPLIPLWHRAEDSKVPGFKATPVRVRRQSAAEVPA
ncbi:FdhF/YdeP family oxidoreductase [Methylibium sp.]|uniref:FdhF/YdeP family oxidoreductase n=1 Tax=Methylibium sp. TaxID=2067992 RepID=UPI0017D50F90|nr:FdhF/YdeP family oxidoreductase [Methylibium sp.]MBA3589147.1 FdhF/YdeP family oxidoreductase [Methylibium sp.]